MSRNKFNKVFNNEHVILPVIHVENKEQAIRNIKISYRTGCDGVFLINHRDDWKKLLDVYKFARNTFPDWWIGLNFLDLDPLAVFDWIIPRHMDISGIWTDNAMISEEDFSQMRSKKILKSISKTNWKGLYFGGVAFKYQKTVKNLKLVTKHSIHRTDVVTTSGSATGKSADIEKIESMRNYLGTEFPLAVASGITPENVFRYLPFVNAFLVATGVSSSFTEISSEKLQLLVNKVRQ